MTVVIEPRIEEITKTIEVESEANLKPDEVVLEAKIEET